MTFPTRLKLAVAFGCAFFASTVCAQGLAELAKAREVFVEARAARDKGDAAGYLRHMQEVARLRPDQPGALYRLAGAHALSGDAAAAARLLKRIAAQGLIFNAAEDADFANIRTDPAFVSALEALQANRGVREAGSVAFKLSEAAFLPEGLAYDPASRDFFIASVHQRKIVRRTAAGSEQPFGSGREDGLWSVLALRVDAQRGVLWATTAAIEQTSNLQPADLGRTAVFKYDLATGKVLKRLEAPRGKTPLVFGDLTVSSSGKVYVSEAQQGGIWRVTDDRLELFVPPGRFASPQGMTFPDQGNWMYVADYSLGLMRVDVATRKVERVKGPEDVCLLGMDGVVRYGGDLIVTQNGIRPQRVMRIRLDAEGQVASASVLDANHREHAEPTLGVLVGDEFFYVANSQWELFAKGQAAATVKPPVILKVPLGK